MPESVPDMTPGELLRRCGRNLDDRDLWGEFQRRFQKRVFLYLLRSGQASGEDAATVQEHLMDLAQEVCLRLVQNDGRMLKSFRKDSEFAVRSFLARVATTVVSDHFRYQSAEKRQGQVISIEQARETIEKLRVGATDLGSSRSDSQLAWIDLERELSNSGELGFTARDLLIFKLYYVDGFTAGELGQFPGFRLSAAGIEAAVNRVRSRLRDAQARGKSGA